MRARHGVVIASLVALMSVAAAPAATSAEPLAAACPTGQVPATGFTDTVRSPHRAAIDCAAWWGVTTGRTATSFGPGDAITRGQTASMIARLLAETDVDLDDPPSGGFTDTVGHLFEDDIDLLASLGVVNGMTATTFVPDRPIDRAQMASIIARAFELAIGDPLPSGTADFDDVHPDNVHRVAIGSLAAAGITTGTSATRYSPRDSVVRGQMASFLLRSTSRLVDRGHATLPTTQPTANDPYNAKTRGAWVHLFDGALKDRSSINAVVAELAAADANTIIAQVARRHDAYYDSDVLVRTPDPQVAADFDVLAELLEAAHARGMEVHAWISVAPTTHGIYDDLPNPPGWVASTHGRQAPVAQRWVTQTADGAWSDYLDLGVPAVQDHVAAVVGELADRYAVDGIHLDYVRYQSSSHGYHPLALARFQEATGRTDRPSPTDVQWMQWRRSQGDEIMRRARAAINETGNPVELSAAVITWGDGPRSLDRPGFRGTLPFTRTLQDWDGWVRNGLVDAVFPMNYYRAHLSEPAQQFSRWLAYEQMLASQTDVRVVPGPGGYLNRPPAAYEQVQTAIRQGDGAMVYSYQQPTEDHSRDLWQQLANTRWGYAPLQ